jgi:hypothetical protein
MPRHLTSGKIEGPGLKASNGFGVFKGLKAPAPSGSTKRGHPENKRRPSNEEQSAAILKK